MDRIDLHTHSTASDGSMTPSELVRHAASCGLRAVALTDHDTTVGLTEAQQAANEIGIELVHGVELATWLDKTEFHIVGLDINERDPQFPDRHGTHAADSGRPQQSDGCPYAGCRCGYHP